MSSFSYKARDEVGRLIQGKMAAQNRTVIADKLTKMGYFIISIDEAKGGFDLNDFQDRFQKIRYEDIVIFNIQLANMVGSGLTLLSSLKSLVKQIENPRLRKIVDEVRKAVEGGENLSEALAKHPRVFSNLFVSMIRAGEASGKLDLVLNRLAEFAEHDANLRQSINAALSYPIFLSVVALMAIVFLTLFVIPNFINIFQKSGISLPAPTQFLYNTGEIIRKFWLIIIMACFIIGLLLKFYFKTERGRVVLDVFKLKMPVFGSLFYKVAVSRFARSLATLVDSGVPILTSLKIVHDIVDNEVIARVIRQVHDGVKEGAKISETFKISDVLPQDAMQMISVGEESGTLGKMLNKIADFYDMAIQFKIKKLTALLEPVFLLFIGGVVGVIMSSVLLPIFDLAKTLKR